MTAELAHSERDGLLANLSAEFGEELRELMGRVESIDESIPERCVPRGVQIELVVHDGHAPGHTALWLPGPRVLIAGDMLSDIELPLPFYPDDLLAYRQALDRLAPYAARAELIIPGHGNVGTDALARLDADRRYLDDVTRTASSADPRIANPGMHEAHEHLKAMARDC